MIQQSLVVYLICVVLAGERGKGGRGGRERERGVMEGGGRERREGEGEGERGKGGRGGRGGRGKALLFTLLRYLGGLRLLQATCKKFYEYCSSNG